MDRLLAIEQLMKEITDELVITSAGKISREVFYVKDRPENFYVQGSMGATLGISIGVALNTSKKVVAIIGDGEALMSLGSLVLLNKFQKEDKLQNLKLYIIDNNQYQSTGGQQTISKAIDFRILCSCIVIFCGGNDVGVPRIDIPHEKLKERFMDAIKK